MIDKHGVLARIEGAKIDLGCGARKRAPDYVGIDRLDSDAVDVVGDAFDVLRAIPDHVLVEVYSSHFFEHVEDVEALLEEVWRVLQPRGRLEVVTPHFSNPYSWSDLTHKHAFGLYSFSYFSHDDILKRRVPTYARDLRFRLESVSLVFKSSPPFYGRHGVKKVFQAVFNAGRAMQEFYEENLCFLLPCYEVRYVLSSEPAPIGSDSLRP